MENQIKKQIEIKAPVSRVWRALTDYREFGEWFRVKLVGPFVKGVMSTGHMTYPGYEHLPWEAVVQEIQPEQLFSFSWHPNAGEPNYDYSKESSTVLEFRLEPTATGSLLTVTESGFENIPADRRLDAFRRNEGGWEIQVKNISEYVSQDPWVETGVPGQGSRNSP